MKINKTILATAIVAVALTSCETKENSHRETQPFYMLNYVTNGTDENYSVGTSAISIEYIGESASSLSIREVVMSDDSKKSFDVTNLTNKSVTNGINFALSSTSSASGMSDVNINLFGGTNFIQQWNLYYSFKSGNDVVYGMSCLQNFFSATTVTSPVGSPYVTEEAAKNRYQISINEKDLNSDKRTLDLYVAGASFMKEMPAMNMVFKNIPFKIKDGKLTFAIDYLIPCVLKGENGNKEEPNDKYPISNLEGSGMIGDEITLKYSCAPTIQGDNSVTFDVLSKLKFRLKKPTTQQ